MRSLRISRSLKHQLRFYGLYLAAPITLVLICVIGGFYWMRQQPDKRPIEWSSIVPKETLREWRYIVIHHSANVKGSTSGIDRHHREVNKWDGIGYHFVIGNGRGMRKGRIEYTFRWHLQREGAHAGGTDKRFNQQGIGICIIGNFDKKPPDDFLVERCAELCACLIEANPGLSINTIMPHQHVPGKETKCPGQHFNMLYLKRLVAKSLADRRRIREQQSAQ